MNHMDGARMAAIIALTTVLSHFLLSLVIRRFAE